MFRRAIKLSVFVLIGCVFFAGAIWLLEMALEDRESKYAGKTVSEWVAGLQSADMATAASARATITNRVIPALCDRMFNDTNDSQIKLKLVESLNSLPWGFVNAAEAPFRRQQAALDLGAFGANAATAIPELIRCAKSEDFARGGAIEALGKIHSEPSVVVPFLMVCLDDPDEDIKIHATEALTEFGPLAKPAVPKLIPLLKFHSKELPYLTRKALEAIEPGALSTNRSSAGQ